MARKVKAKKRIKRAATPRDPFWRVRRALGAKRVDSRRAYTRTDARKAERDATDDAE